MVQRRGDGPRQTSHHLRSSQWCARVTPCISLSFHMYTLIPAHVYTQSQHMYILRPKSSPDLLAICTRQRADTHWCAACVRWRGWNREAANTNQTQQTQDRRERERRGSGKGRKGVLIDRDDMHRIGQQICDSAGAIAAGGLIPVPPPSPSSISKQKGTQRAHG